MENLKGKVALVTGASSGIGEALVKKLLNHDLKVVACARRFDRLETLSASDHFFPYKCDLRNTDEIEKMFEWIKRQPKLGHVDVCVCNAGFTGGSTLMEGDVQEWQNMLQVNVVAACLCAQKSVKLMGERGHVVFMNSMSGHAVHPHPQTRFYSATKFAMTALVEGFRDEVGQK